MKNIFLLMSIPAIVLFAQSTEQVDVDSQSVGIINTLSSFSDVRVEETYLVSGEMVLPPGTSVILAKRLKFEDGATLKVDPSISKFKIIALKTVTGKNCKIVAIGSSPGQKGVDLDLFLGFVDSVSLEINTSGAAGNVGSTGYKGARGRDAHCTGDGAGPGGKGGTGGKGGPGGAGGNVHFVISNQSFPELITISAKGGTGGPGGAGGPGGDGGAGKRCVGYKRGSGHPGAPGNAGAIGDNGEDGKVSIEFGKTVYDFLR